jgi:hypothetical protein
MSDKQFEPCTLEEATHVEIGDTTYEFGNGIVTKIKDGTYPRIRVINESFGNDYINESSFPIFGIKPLREKKREPIEFEAVFVHYDGEWHRLFSLHGLKHVGCREAKFRCVEILEEKK